MAVTNYTVFNQMAGVAPNLSDYKLRYYSFTPTVQTQLANSTQF
jgi:hypothetical protein